MQIITPLRLADSDTAVLIIRGWVYSPDGTGVNLTAWREGIAVDSTGRFSTMAEIEGIAIPIAAKVLPIIGVAAVARDSADMRIQSITPDRVARALPYPALSMLVQITPADSVNRAGVPAPVAAPVLSEGAHLSYAIQWFSFAIIAVVGCAQLLRRSGSDSAVVP